MLSIGHRIRAVALRAAAAVFAGNERVRRAFALRLLGRTKARNPAPRGNFGQEKGPGDYPGPCVLVEAATITLPYKTGN